MKNNKTLIFVIFRPNMKSINEILNENNQILTNDIPDCQSAFIPNRTCKYSFIGIYLMCDQQ